MPPFLISNFKVNFVFIINIYIDNIYEAEVGDESDSATGRYKEEGEQQIKFDAKDRNKII